MRYLVLLAIIAGTLPVLAGKYQPVHTGEVTVEGQSVTQIKAAVKKALINRGWRVRAVERDHINARLNLRGHQADINITWDNGTIILAYVKSSNLGYRVKRGKKLIHRNYNKWIINLERDIQGFLDQ